MSISIQELPQVKPEVSRIEIGQLALPLHSYPLYSLLSLTTNPYFQSYPGYEDLNQLLHDIRMGKQVYDDAICPSTRQLDTQYPLPSNLIFQLVNSQSLRALQEGFRLAQQEVAQECGSHVDNFDVIVTGFGREVADTCGNIVPEAVFTTFTIDGKPIIGPRVISVLAEFGKKNVDGAALTMHALDQMMNYTYPFFDERNNGFAVTQAKMGWISKLRHGHSASVEGRKTSLGYTVKIDPENEQYFLIGCTGDSTIEEASAITYGHLSKKWIQNLYNAHTFATANSDCNNQNLLHSQNNFAILAEKFGITAGS